MPHQVSAVLRDCCPAAPHAEELHWQHVQYSLGVLRDEFVGWLQIISCGCKTAAVSVRSVSAC